MLRNNVGRAATPAGKHRRRLAEERVHFGEVLLQHDVIRIEPGNGLKQLQTLVRHFPVGRRCPFDRGPEQRLQLFASNIAGRWKRENRVPGRALFQQVETIAGLIINGADVRLVAFELGAGLFHERVPRLPAVLNHAHLEGVVALPHLAQIHEQADGGRQLQRRPRAEQPPEVFRAVFPLPRLQRPAG